MVGHHDGQKYLKRVPFRGDGTRLCLVCATPLREPVQVLPPNLYRQIRADVTYQRAL